MGKRFTRIFMTLGLMALVLAGPAMAVPYYGPALSDNDDSYWSLDGSATATIYLENANYRNRNAFGVYSGTSSYQLFSGAQGFGDSITFDFADLAASLGSDSFGFYLDSPDGRFYSDTSMNRDKTDHMLAYLAENGDFFLGFEDLRGGGDLDYDDLVIAIRKYVPDASPAPVPEPGTLLLLGSGLLGLAYRRKNRSA